MWRMVDRLCQVMLWMATVSTAFVVAALAWSTFTSPDAADRIIDPAGASVEVRLSGHGDVSRLYIGEPLVVDVVLLNLEARRGAVDTPGGPSPRTATASFELDTEGPGRRVPWEHRLIMTVSTPGGAMVLNSLEWNRKLLEVDVDGSGRRLELAPVRTTFVLDPDDLATLLPGPYVIRATLPNTIVPAERVAVMPLEFELVSAPTRDDERAKVSLTVARVAALRGQPSQAVEAALTALALDPLQDEALSVVAEAREQQGEIESAIEWYERYLDTLPDTPAERRQALTAYIEALRQQESRR